MGHDASISESLDTLLYLLVMSPQGEDEQKEDDRDMPKGTDRNMV